MVFFGDRICFGFGVCLTDGLFGCWFSLFYKEWCFTLVVCSLTEGSNSIRSCRFYHSSPGRLRRMRDWGPYTLLRNHPYPEPRTAWFTACGGVDSAAAGLQGYSLCNSGAVACRHFDISFGCFVFRLVSLAFQSGCLAYIACFSFVLMEKRRRL